MDLPAHFDDLEKAKEKRAAFIVTFVKWEEEIAELKARSLSVDPAIHEELALLKMHELVKESCITGIPEYRTQKSN